MAFSHSKKVGVGCNRRTGFLNNNNPDITGMTTSNVNLATTVGPAYHLL